MFRKSSGQEQKPAVSEAPVTVEQRRAMAVAVATAATAEAAVVAAQAAAEVVRLARPSASFVREHYAAIVIQTAFRGYLVLKRFDFSRWFSFSFLVFLVAFLEKRWLL